MNEESLVADSIVKALAYTENGGAPNLSNPSAGKTGEMKSIFQFTPNTWKQYSKETFGRDNVPMNADTETYVANSKVTSWLKKGHTASEIASMWNAGEGRPNAYKENHKGINKQYGIAYDTPSYAKKVVDYSRKFYGESKQKAGSMQGSATGNVPKAKPTSTPKGLIGGQSSGATNDKS